MCVLVALKSRACGSERADYSGRMYLLENNSHLVQILSVKGQWWEHLWEVDDAAQQQVEQMVAAMARQDGTDEALKQRDPLRWAGLMNNYQHCAEELVLKELIYT